MEYKTPRWLSIFIEIARPGVMTAMFGLLVLGGLIFALIELVAPNEGARAMGMFVGFFAAINDEYYETLRFMFAAYVIGRSGQEIAKEITQQKQIMADIAPVSTKVDNATINADNAIVNERSNEPAG
jgi:hypothetical protein